MINIEFDGIALRLHTHPRLFSPTSLDPGTRELLLRAPLAPGSKTLDLGCGLGAVGLLAAHICGPENIWMTDIDPLAIEFAHKNALENALPTVHIVRSDGLRALDETAFDLILSNPPYHADFSVAKHFIEKGFNRLKLGGKMLMVTKRRDWYRNKFISVFGGVKLTESNGYIVFEAERRTLRYAGK